MLIRRGQHTDLDAQAEAEPADSVVTRDYYTQLPQNPSDGQLNRSFNAPGNTNSNTRRQ